ncbi:hypothetical protein NIES2104_57680 [Leptolyngbya sp. NIES-2104]|nr:hypothetical protein NIES2104_57680 [Leptolyngbya sp. NIES-2104]
MAMAVATLWMLTLGTQAELQQIPIRMPPLVPQPTLALVLNSSW